MSFVDCSLYLRRSGSWHICFVVPGREPEPTIEPEPTVSAEVVNHGDVSSLRMMSSRRTTDLQCSAVVGIVPLQGQVGRSFGPEDSCLLIPQLQSVRPGNQSAPCWHEIRDCLKGSAAPFWCRHAAKDCSVRAVITQSSGILQA